MSNVFLRLGSEFLVNTETVSDQLNPAITGLANGGFVVSWQDFSGTLGDASSYSIKAQLFSADGTRVGDEFLVNTQTASIQGDPKIASLANGGFVVSWADFSGSLGDASGTSIKAQLFSTDGTRVGTEFLVNTRTAGFQTEPTITSLASGGFVVSWWDFSGTPEGTFDSSIKAQLFSPDGTRLGTEFLVSTETVDSQIEPTITGLANGGFVVSWPDAASGTVGDDSGAGIKAQLFSADGAKVGTDFFVSSQTGNAKIEPTITALANGGFVVSWTDFSGTLGDDSGTSIKAQLFAADGARVGNEFLVNTQTPSYQRAPTISDLANGGFVVSWTDFSGMLEDASPTSIKAQLFAADGTRVGTEFLVNTQTASFQTDPTITGLANGGFVVSWRDESGTLGDASGFSIKAQIYVPNEAPTNLVATPGGAIAENTAIAVGALVATFAYADDALGTETVTLSGADAALFQIVGNEVRWLAATTPDFEAKPSYSFTINVDDPTLGTGPELSQLVTIDVTDVNEAPTNLLVTPGLPVVENTAIPAGTVRATFTYRDDALGTETVTLSGADAALFQIVGNEVRWLAATTPDFEAKPSYSFTINVDDPTLGTGPELSQLVTIDVTDVNEAPTNLLVTPGLPVVENAAIPAGTVRATFTYRDDALGTETVTLSGADAALFQIVGNEVRWLAATTPDFEAKPSYSFTINVDDPTLGTGPELSQSVTINVTDVLETGGFTPGNDIVTLPAGSPPVNALAGNDTIIVNAASPQRVDGAAGLDHFVLSGVRSSDAQVYRTNGSDPASQIYRLYDGILGRDPDPIGFAYWVGQIDQGRQLTSVASEMLASPEGAPRWVAGVTDAQFATLAYSNILGRAPTTLEASSLTADLAGGLARGAALARLTESAEETDGGRLDAVVISGLGRHELSNVERVVFSDGIVGLDIDQGQTTGVIARLYDMAFDRAGDRVGLTYWAREADSGRSAIDIAGAFVASPEGASLARLSNADFVTALYNRGLDRAPDAVGLAYWTGRVASDGRALVLAEMSESPEHVGIVDNRIDAPLPLLDRYLVPGV